MRYTDAQYTAVMDAIEASGGAKLPDPCIGEKIDYERKGRKFPLRTTECRNRTRAVVNYDPGEDEIKERGGGYAPVCLMDDNVGLWPRFREAYRNA